MGSSVCIWLDHPHYSLSPLPLSPKCHPGTPLFWSWSTTKGKQGRSKSSRGKKREDLREKWVHRQQTHSKNLLITLLSLRNSCLTFSTLSSPLPSSGCISTPFPSLSPRPFRFPGIPPFSPPPILLLQQVYILTFVSACLSVYVSTFCGFPDISIRVSYGTSFRPTWPDRWDRFFCTAKPSVPPLPCIFSRKIAKKYLHFIHEDIHIFCNPPAEIHINMGTCTFWH